jgi:hypothetical protein
MCAIIEQVAERFQPTSAKFAHDVVHPREAPRLSSAEAGPPHSPLSHLLPSGVNHLTRHTEATIQRRHRRMGRSQELTLPYNRHML